MPEIIMPEGFSIENTPLVSFRRVDLLLNETELHTLYHSSAFLLNPPTWTVKISVLNTLRHSESRTRR
jgi:hypothetical protein